MARKTTAGAASSPSAPAVDLNLTPEEQAFLAQEALGFKLPSDIPDVSGPKLVDRIPGTVFMSADEVQAAALKQQEEDAQDEIFKTAILVVPFTFCFLLMDILIHQQYGRQPAFLEELGRLATTVPRTSLPTARVPFRRGTDLQPLRLQSSRDSSSTVSRHSANKLRAGRQRLTLSATFGCQATDTPRVGSPRHSCSGWASSPGRA